MNYNLLQIGGLSENCWATIAILLVVLFLLLSSGCVVMLTFKDRFYNCQSQLPSKQQRPQSIL